MSVAKLVSNATIKRSALAAFFALMTLSAQGQDQRVSVEMKNKPLSALFSTLEKQAKVSIDFAVNQVNVKQNITVDMQNQPIGEVLKKVLPALGYTYEFKGDHVIVKPRSSAGKMKQITGVVMDTNNEPLMGANIAVPETGTIAITDIDGKYTIFAPDEATLVYSYIGFAPQEVKIKGRKNFNIFLAEDQKALDEVVVTGFQTISRERASGSAVIVNKDKLDKIKAPSITANLEGLIPGFNNYGGRMNIRGTASFAINSRPLIVVDGMPIENITSESGFENGVVSGLDLINPDDVESITVLKDAAATSLYGVRASNGVIVVTTKKGSSSRPSVNFSANFYISEKTDYKYNDYASTSDIIDYEIDYLINDPTYKQDPMAYFNDVNSFQRLGYMTKVDQLYYQMAQGKMTQGEVDAKVNALRGNDYRKEYLKHFRRIGFVQDYNVSISQSSDFSNTYFSARYQGDKDNNQGFESDKFSMNLRNIFNFTKWFKLTTGLNFNQDQARDNADPFRRRGNKFTGHTSMMPYEQITGSNGERSNMVLMNANHVDWINANPLFQNMFYNPLTDNESGSYTKDKGTYIRANADAQFNVIEGLTFDVKFQYESIISTNDTYNSKDSYEMRELVNKYTVYDETYDNATYYIPQGGRLTSALNRLQNMNGRAQLNYQKQFNKVHDFSALLGGEIRENKIRTTYDERFGYDDQLLTSQSVDFKTLSMTGVNGILNAQPQRLQENSRIADVTHRYISAYANVGYTYDSRYSFNGSVRMDQADLFGSDPKYRYRPLWSLGASWNMSNESFMKPYSWVNMLKLRTTYGITGNVDQNSSPYLIGSVGNSFLTGKPVTTINTPPNKLLRWEKTGTFNIGADFSLFNRLNGSLEYYDRRSSDLLTKKRFDPSTGFDQGKTNNGKMTNKGLELSLSYDWIKNSDWKFNTYFSLAYNTNKITDIDFKPSSATDMLYYPSHYYLEGNPFNTIYSYQYRGVNEVGDPVVLNKDGEEVSAMPVREIEALIATGQLDPKVSGALNLTLGYKGFELFTRFVYYAGHSLRNDVTPLYTSVNGGDIHKDIAGRWTETNKGEIPAMGKYGPDLDRPLHWKYADSHIRTASFIKARNIGLSYSFPQSLIRNLKMNSMVLRFQVDNPFYIAFNKEGIDPEAFDANRGIRNNQIAKVYTLGINVNF